MPRRDRTGPVRAGPGAGWCAGHNGPGFGNRGPRLGLQLGYRGGGRGWRNMRYATGLPGWAREQPGAPLSAGAPELAELKAEAIRLAEGLEVVRKRIAEIKGRGAADAAL